MKIHPLRPFLVPLALLAIASPVFAAISIPLNPVADAFVTSANATGNYGGGGALGISATGLPNGELQALMMFNFSAAKTQLDTTFGVGGWSVESITLQLAASNPGNPVFNSPSAAGNIAIRWFNDDSWVEGTGTPANPNVAGVNFNSLSGLLASGIEATGSYAFGGGTSGLNVIPLALSSGLFADVTAGSTASLNLYAGDAAVTGVFNSRSFSTPANWPVLTLTAVPEPSTGLTAILALSLSFIRRRR